MPRTASNLTRGIQPHFLNRLIEVDAEETPAFSLLPKGEPLKNPIAQEPIDNKDTASKEGKLDNEPTQGAKSQDNYRILESWNHWLDEPVSVGEKAQRLVDQAGVGLDQQYGRAVMKKTKAIKTAADQITCDNVDQRAEGTNGKGSETRGLFKWCDPAGQDVKPVDELYRTPAAQRSTVNFDVFFEETFQDLLNAHYDNTGKNGKFTALAGIFFKQRVSNWSVYDDTAQPQSYIRRFNSDASDEKKILNAMVNVLQCDGGRVEMHLSRNLLWDRSPSAKGEFSSYSMIGWNEGAVKYRWGWEPRHRRLPEDGAGMKGHIDMDFAVCADPTGMISYIPAALTE